MFLFSWVGRAYSEASDSSGLASFARVAHAGWGTLAPRPKYFVNKGQSLPIKTGTGRFSATPALSRVYSRGVSISTRVVE